ncbi:MAG: RNA polymerase sigma factor [Planctomycetota bacterium]
MSESSSEHLLRAAASDKAAMERLLVENLPRLLTWLRLRMGAALRAREAPEDLVQSVAREAIGELSQLEWRGEAAFRHWLFVRAQNKLNDKIKFHRAQKRDPTKEVEFTESHAALWSGYAALCTPSRDLAQAEAMARIEQAFDSLPADYQEAIALHRLCGLDYAQIAERMERSEGAVRNLVYRGLSRLALELGFDRSPGAE